MVKCLLCSVKEQTITGFMYEEGEIEEQHKVTKVCRKSRRKSRHRREVIQINTTQSGAVLRNVKEGPQPKIKIGEMDKKEERIIYRNVDILEENDGRIYMKNTKKGEQRFERIFLSECVYAENEIAVLKSKRIWKLRETGRRGLDRFRRAVEFVLFARQICPCEKKSKLNHHETILFFLDTCTNVHYQELDNSSTVFDTTSFKSIGQKSLANSVKITLDVPPHSRTDYEVNSLIHLLQSFSKFSNYPHYVQKGLCQNGWYARFDSTKVIAKEGCRADCYYFILTGIAVSRCLDATIESSDRRRQVAEFHRAGDTLGEREILTNRDRPATIVCKDPVEVLGVDRQTLADIFNSADGSACLEFLRGIPDLQALPLNLLQTSHFSCSLHRYRRGAVIVKNSNKSEWIYVIKSGSCQVYASIQHESKKQKLSRILQHQRPSAQALLPTHTIFSKEDLCSMSPEKENIKRNPINHRRKKQGGVALPSISLAPKAMVSMEMSNTSPNNEQGENKSHRRHDSDNTENIKCESQERNLSPNYVVKLETLTEKDYFGLQSLLYTGMPNLSLVSNGVECVLISKQFLQDNIDCHAKKRLHDKILPYPNLSHLNTAVDNKIAWELYKDKVVQEVLR